MGTPGELHALGWDVRGWRSREQATAVARLKPNAREIEWLGVSPPFQFRSGIRPGLRELLEPAVGDMWKDLVRKAETIVVAIDAPLEFPAELHRFLKGEPIALVVPEREIDNPLAYRGCERWVAEHFGRKPLSATFDKLGNNASLAIAISRTLECEGFTRVPQSGARTSRTVIEVYPALVKKAQKGSRHAVPRIARHLPPEVEPGSDQYDAAICAVLGLAFQGAHARLELPPVIPPPVDVDMREGWIYTIPVGFRER